MNPELEAAKVAVQNRRQIFKWVVGAALGLYLLVIGLMAIVFVVFLAPKSKGNSCYSGNNAPLVGNDNIEKAYNFFLDEGLKDYQAAGIVGNLWWESGGVDPTSQEDGSKDPFPKNNVGFGIAQWTFTSRQQPLVDLAKSQGVPVTDLGIQLDYVWQELNGPYAKALSDLKKTKDVDSATVEIMNEYEAPGDPHRQDRIDRAEKTLNLYGKNQPGGGPGGNGDCGSVAGYQNPFRDIPGLGSGRIDEGVDFTGAGPVYALGNGTVTHTDGHGWPRDGSGAQAFIIVQLNDGPAKGKYVYTAENCVPRVKVGDAVTANTVICDMVNDYPWVEIGWAAGSSAQVAAAGNVYKEGFETAYGVNFNQLLVKLGVKTGTCDTGSDPSCTVLGQLPSGWPQW